MMFIKGGELIAGIFLAVNLDSVPTAMLGVLKDGILNFIKNPLALIGK